jgi:hypothetical protein
MGESSQHEFIEQVWTIATIGEVETVNLVFDYAQRLRPASMDRLVRLRPAGQCGMVAFCSWGAR